MPREFAPPGTNTEPSYNLITEKRFPLADGMDAIEVNVLVAGS